jgi:hypothetical protein
VDCLEDDSYLLLIAAPLMCQESSCSAVLCCMQDCLLPMILKMMGCEANTIPLHQVPPWSKAIKTNTLLQFLTSS